MILAIDLGGSSIKYGIVDSKGNITNEGSRVSNNNDYDEYIRDILEIANDNLDVYGIALSVPGGVLNDGTTIGLTSIPCIENQNLKKDIEQAVNKIVSIANDASCTIMSELFDDPEMKNGVGVVIGSGVGGGIFMNGNLINGKDGVTAEFGVQYNLKSNGAIERLTLSTVHMVEKHNEKYGKNINARQIFNNYKQGEKHSTDTINDFFKRLAVLCLNIESSIHPDKIVFAGGITQEEQFFELFKKSYNELKKWVEWDLEVEHKVSRFKHLANLPGAAACWINENK